MGWRTHFLHMAANYHLKHMVNFVAYNICFHTRRCVRILPSNGSGSFRAKTISNQDISSGTTFRVTSSQLSYMGFNSLVLVLYVPKYTFSTYYYIKNDFYQMHIDIFYHISFKRSFDYAVLKRYEDLPKQT